MKKMRRKRITDEGKERGNKTGSFHSSLLAWGSGGLERKGGKRDRETDRERMDRQLSCESPRSLALLAAASCPSSCSLLPFWLQPLECFTTLYLSHPLPTRFLPPSSLPPSIPPSFPSFRFHLLILPASFSPLPPPWSSQQTRPPRGSLAHPPPPAAAAEASRSVGRKTRGASRFGGRYEGREEGREEGRQGGRERRNVSDM